MFYAIYRWKLKEGMEASFIDEWKRATSKIYEECGSYGSRLHLAEDGTYIAYAKWSTKEERRKCWEKWDNDEEFQQLMQRYIDRKYPDIFMEDISDLLMDNPFEKPE